MTINARRVAAVVLASGVLAGGLAPAAWANDNQGQNGSGVTHANGQGQNGSGVTNANGQGQNE
jgi:hypothetical protein